MHAIHGYYIAPGVVVTGDVVFADGVNLWFGTVIRGDLARVSLGPRVNLQDGCIVHTDHDCPQVIEEGVVVGHRAVLHGARIGRDSLIGMGAMLLSGSEIGEECLIAAGTLATAAHRTLPFGTRVRVTDVQSKRSVVVRINDRGPFMRGRIIDVSRGAAIQLGMIGRGVATVDLQVVN